MLSWRRIRLALERVRDSRTVQCLGGRGDDCHDAWLASLLSLPYVPASISWDACSAQCAEYARGDRIAHRDSGYTPLHYYCEPGFLLTGVNISHGSCLKSCNSTSYNMNLPLFPSTVCYRCRFTCG